MEYTSMDGSGSRKGCKIATAVAIVFGVLFLGTLIGIIVLAASAPSRATSSSSAAPPPAPPTPVEPIVFNEYTAEYFQITVDGKGYHQIFTENQVEYVFAPYKWASDIHDVNGNVLTREAMDGEDNQTVLLCQDLISHKNCLKVSSAGDGSLSTEGFDLILKGQKCYDLNPYLQVWIPNRTLTSCDFYMATTLDGSAVYQILLESGNNYPVMTTAKFFNEEVAQGKVYSSFKPGKPEDENVIKPFPDVTVYDFRDGVVNSAERETFTKKEGSANPYIDRIVRNAQLRRKLHLPMKASFGLSRARVRNTVVRDTEDIPESFDGRTQWPACAGVIGTITNQDICGSCWAMASSGVLADRYCVAKNVTQQLSPQYMVYCGTQTFGCNGGDSISAWNQLVEQGTVSEACVPFTGHDGRCPTKCKNGDNITEDIKYHAKEYVVPWGNTSESREQAIQSEIMNRGSVVASFFVFSDFAVYNGGVYRRSESAFLLGAHAVRVIGWGKTDDGVKYWLVANSWDKDWAEDGYFRIARGTNECNFEEEVFGGIVN